MKKRKVVSILLCLALVIGTMTGCGQKKEEVKEQEKETLVEAVDGTKEEEKAEAEPVTLKIYAQYADEDTKVPYDYAVEELAKAYPHVTLELDVQAQDDGQKLQTYAATGNLPDIFQVGLQQIESFKTSGNIMVLNDIAKSTGFEDKVFESAKSILYNEDGNIYAFPYAGNELVVLYYNKAIFEQYNVKVPETYDELIAASKVFNDNGITPLSIFAKEKWITTALFDVIATRYDAGGIDKLDKGQANITDEAYKNATEMLSKLVKAGLVAKDATNLNYDQAASQFYEGKAAMFLNGQWEIESATEKLGADVDWMYYPSYDKESYEAGKTVWAGGGAPGGYAVNPNSKHAELAAEVAAFISEKYCEAKYLFRSNPILAVDVDVERSEDFTPMMQRLADEMPKMTSTTKFSWGLTNAKFKTGIEDQSQFLLIPDYTPEEFFEEMGKIIASMNE